MEKPLLRIIKYYICSAHFADDCFTDPPYNTTLKRISRPFQVPVPTIFESNLSQVLGPIANTNQIQAQNHVKDYNNSQDILKNQNSEKLGAPSDSNEIISIENSLLIENEKNSIVDIIEASEDEENDSSSTLFNYINNNEETIFDEDCDENVNNEFEETILGESDVENILHPEDEAVECVISEQPGTIYNYLETCRLCANQYTSDYLLSFHEINNCFALVMKLFPNSVI